MFLQMCRFCRHIGGKNFRENLQVHAKSTLRGCYFSFRLKSWCFTVKLILYLKGQLLTEHQEGDGTPSPRASTS